MAASNPQQLSWNNNVLFGSRHQYQDWSGFDNGSEWSTITPSLLVAQASIEASAIPFDVESRLESPCFGEVLREASIPVDQLRNEILWPGPGATGSGKVRNDSLVCQEADLSSGSHYPGIQTACDVAAADKNTLEPVINTKPAKRKRGRPRLDAPHPKPQGYYACADDDGPARASQLEKNRVAANKCRQQRKEYTSELVTQFTSLAARNEALKADVAFLREQVLSLKNEVLQHAKCGSWVIDSYVTRIAGDLCNGAVPIARTSEPSKSEEVLSPTLSAEETGGAVSDGTSGSPSGQKSVDSRIEVEEFADLWLLNDTHVMED